MRHFLFFLLCLFFATATAHAKTYQGTIGPYPVGMNISLPAEDGEVKGSYFYQKSGVDIALKGTKKGKTITLAEYDLQNRQTGTFLCTQNGAQLSGKWISASGKKELAATLTEISPSKLQNMQLDAFDRKLLPDKDKCYKGKISYTFKNDFVRSLVIRTEHLCGPYPSSETKRKTYNAQSKKDIDLWNEIDPSRMEDFKTYLNQETQKKFNVWREKISDEKWPDILSHSACDKTSANTEQKQDVHTEKNTADFLDAIFTVHDATKIMTDFYVDQDGVHLGRCNYCELPHAAQALDFCDEIILMPSILNQYLKENSILKKIQTP